MINSIIIRKETNNDFEQVFGLNTIAFKQDNEAKLVNALRKNSEVFIPELSIVAIFNSKVVGHILFSKIKIKDEKGRLNETLSLAPMAVDPEFQNQGIGSKLIKTGFKVAIELSFKSVIVLGHENYYPKFGFEPANKWHISPPFNVPANVFMGTELVNDGLKNITGTVIYPKEFESV